MTHHTTDHAGQTADLDAMRHAVAEASAVRTRTSPNPWVGAVVVDGNGEIVGRGATQPPGQAHAEVIALRSAGDVARGATLYVTLEPCAHHGRTPPCVDALIEAGIRRVVVGVEDPDPRVSGRGIAMLRAGGIDVEVGVCADTIGEQLAPYLHHRRTGRPYVVAKVGMTIDGGTAAPDGTSRWITGEAARIDAHCLRAQSDAIVVGAGTVRADDPALTVRHVDGPDPLRVVLGRAPADAKVHPCVEWTGDVEDLLDELGAKGVLQVLVEGGATVLHTLHDRDLVDRYVVYVAPSIFGGVEKSPMIAGRSLPTVDALRRGRFVDVRAVGDDLRIDLVPPRTTHHDPARPNTH